MHQLLYSYSGIDLSLMNFMGDLVNAAINSAIDFELNYYINKFSFQEEIPQHNQLLLEWKQPKVKGRAQKGGGASAPERLQRTPVKSSKSLLANEGAVQLYAKPVFPPPEEKKPVPKSHMTVQDYRQFIRKNFWKYRWSRPKIENMCIDKPKSILTK